MTDRMLGAPAMMDSLCAALGVVAGEVSGDGRVSIDITSCTGMCDQGPALLVNGRAVTRLSKERIADIATLIRSEVPLDQWPSPYFDVEENICRRDALLSLDSQPGEALAVALQLGPDRWLEQMRMSNLRGRGGAGWIRRLHRLA